MSRWIEHFESHPFQNIWESLKKALEETVVNDETVITSVKEVARLKKVVSYLDGIINGIDPELVPEATWDSFHSQANACLQQITTYNSNKAIVHITQANAHVDNLLTYVRPYMIIEGDISKALQSSIKDYAKTIDDYAKSFVNKTSELINDISVYKEQGSILFKDIENTNTLAVEYHHNLFGDPDNENGVKQNIEKLFNEISEFHLKINEFYNETFIGNEEELSTKKSILEAKEFVDEEKDKIEELMNSIVNEIKDINKFHTKIYGDKTDDDEVDGGLSGDLDKLITDMSNFEKEQKIKYKALNAQIEQLLPGATSAGLATAYKDMKITFDDPIKHASLLFYASVSSLVVISFFVAVDSIGMDGVKFIPLGDWSSVLKGLVHKLPYYIPILWLAFFASRRRSESQRLQQEYAHKESLAKSYDSYKQQILDLGDEDKAMQKIFIMKAIDAIAYNASATLDGKHGDKMPVHDMIEKTVEAILKVKDS